MKRNTKRTKRATARRRVARRSTEFKPSPPRSTTQYLAMSARFQDVWNRVVGVISKMRSEKTSLQKASREAGISPTTVKKWSGPTLQKRANGRYAAKTRDHLLRVLMIPTPDGPREVGARGSRQATVLGKYWNAVHRYLQTGDASGLEKFHGKHITDANGARVSLTTDLAELNRLGSAGVLSFESLYARGS